MATTLISLERSLQADGWWYSSATRQWTRMWDDEMQYGQIQEGHFIRVYPSVKEPKQALKETLLHQGWTYSMHDDSFYRVELSEMKYGRIIDGKFVRDDDIKPVMIDESTVRVENGQVFATMADVGEEKYSSLIGVIDDKVWTDDEERDVALHGRSYQARLRDSIAMRAMQALVNNDRISDPKGMALRAYEYADAMMIAREMKRG